MINTELSSLLDSFSDAQLDTYWDDVENSNISIEDLSDFFSTAYEKRHTDLQSAIAELTLFLEISNERRIQISEKQIGYLCHVASLMNPQVPETEDDFKLLQIRFSRNLLYVLKNLEQDQDFSLEYIAYLDWVIDFHETTLVKDSSKRLFSSFLGSSARIVSYLEQRLPADRKKILFTRFVESLLSLEIKLLKAKSKERLENNDNLVTITEILSKAVDDYAMSEGRKACFKRREKIKLSTLLLGLGHAKSSFSAPTREEFMIALRKIGSDELVSLIDEAENYQYSLDKISPLEELLQEGKVHSLEDIIALALRKEEGDIRRALYTATSWMKYFIRPGSKNKFELVRKCIPDQLSVFDKYNTLNTEEKRNSKGKVVFDESLANRLGILYHALHIMSLGCDLSQELILILVGAEYLMYGRDHGTYKRISDIFILLSLPDFEAVLEKYSEE